MFLGTFSWSFVYVSLPFHIPRLSTWDASGAAAALGSPAAPRLAELLPERRLVAGLLVGSSVSVGALAMAPGVWSYGVLRFVQVLCIAPVFPIVVARIAQTHGGEASA